MSERKGYRGLKSRHGIVARPVRPSAAARERYHKSLDDLVKKMGASVLYWVRAAYGREEYKSVPKISKYMNRLNRYWGKKFDELAETAPKRFAESIYKNASTQLSMSVKDAAGLQTVAMDARMGFNTRRKARATRTRAVGNVMRAAIIENVSLIKSIQQKYFRDIDHLVYEGVQRGYDMQYISDEIMKKTGVCRERASLIARDQTSKITETVNNQQCIDLGFTHGKWLHSGIKEEKHRRKSHAEADGKEYELAKGCYIDGEYILPGQLINCKCTFSPIMPAYTEEM
jgi:uncharacterized protein with gpF-like domain